MVLTCTVPPSERILEFPLTFCWVSVETQRGWPPDVAQHPEIDDSPTVAMGRDRIHNARWRDGFCWWLMALVFMNVPGISLNSRPWIGVVSCWIHCIINKHENYLILPASWLHGWSPREIAGIHGWWFHVLPLVIWIYMANWNSLWSRRQRSSKIQSLWSNSQCKALLLWESNPTGNPGIIRKQRKQRFLWQKVCKCNFQ